MASPGHTGKPPSILEGERDRLADIWGCQEQPAPWFEAPPDDWREIPAPTVDAFIKAAKTFPTTTASTWDGFHPRHYALLTEPQAQTVIELYRLMERAGVTPRQCRAIFGKMIPKHKVGAEKVSLRSIGLLPSLYRHWSRLRQEEARNWEAQHRSPLLGHQGGRSIMETTFVQALRGEAAVTGGEHTGAFLWDLANFYEFVNHELLWERARAKGFPLAILAVALNQARAKRYLGLGDVAVDARFPRRGLAAGDSFATYLVQIYTLEPLERWSSRHPAVPLSLFIDDFLGSTVAPEEHQVVGRLTSAAADLHELVEQDLGCQVAQHKSVVVASSDRLLRRLSTAFGRFTGQAARSGSNLGVDFAPGRQRAHKKGVSVLRKREDGLRRRLRRLGALRRKGYDMRKLYVTGLQSYAFYGAEVVGVDPQQLSWHNPSTLA